jgi:hypothetical protein
MELERVAFLQMLESPLRCHLVGLTMCDAAVEDLLQLHARCSQLEELIVSVDGPSVVALMASMADTTAFCVHAWPSSLRTLQLRLQDDSLVQLQLLLDALPFSVPGLQSLNVRPYDDETTLDFTALLQLPQLTRLVTPSTLMPLQSAVVKQLRTLIELDVNQGLWRASDLLALLSDGPHQLQRLQKINVNFMDLDVVSVPHLLTLPGLPELSPFRVDPACFPLLHPFPHLRTLNLSISAAVGAGKMDGSAVAGLLCSLRDMPLLCSLTLSLSVEQELAEYVAAWKTLLDGLDAAAPNLRELTLIKCTLPSLEQLNAGVQLRGLHLHECDFKGAQFTAAEALVQWVRSMRHLERLAITRCNFPLTDAQRMQLTPPSLLIPSLRQFRWGSRHVGRAQRQLRPSRNFVA